MNRVITNRRITKPTAFVIVFVALVLIFGIMFTSVNFTARAETSNPWGTTLTANGYSQATVGVASGSTSWSYTPSTSDRLTTADSVNNSRFTAYNSWTSPSTAGTYYTAFFYTFKVEDSHYSSLAALTASAGGTVSGSISSANGEGKVKLWIYAGLGQANSSSTVNGTLNETVSPYAGFVEAKGVFSDVNDKTVTTTASSFSLSMTDATYENVIVSGTNKYIRLGIFMQSDVTATSGAITISNVAVGLSLSPYSATSASMTLPTGNANVNNGSFAGLEEHLSQSSAGMSTISKVSSGSKTVNEFTGVDNTKNLSSYGVTGGGHFNTSNKNTWTYDNAPSHSNLLYHVGFMHTIKLSDDVYDKFLSGKVTLSSLTVGATNFTNGKTSPTIDARLMLYVGIGTAPNDRSAVSYRGFNEVNKVFNPTLGSTEMTAGVYYSSNGLNGVSLSDVSLATSASSSSENKYLRIAFFTEIWASTTTSGENMNISGLNLTYTLHEELSYMSVPTDGNNDPAIKWSTTQFSEGTTGGYFVQQDLETISSTSFTRSNISSDFTTVDSVRYVNNSTENGKFTSNNDWTYAGGGDKLYHTMFMYTFKLDPSVFNAISTGANQISLSVTGNRGISVSNSSGGKYNGDIDAWLYIGLGTAYDDASAVTYSGFEEISYKLTSKGDQANATYGGANYGAFPDSVRPCGSFSKTTFSTSTSNAENKYLRIAFYAECWPGSAGSTMKIDSLNFTLSLKEPEIAGNIMSTPGTVFATENTNDTTIMYAGNNVAGWSSYTDTMYQNREQASLGSITGTGTVSATDFTLVSDREDHNFTDNRTWSSNFSSGVENAIFIYTAKLSDDVYKKIINGTYKLNFTVSGSLASSNGAVHNWLYVGIGNATGDNVAKTYLGFKETSSVLGTNNPRQLTYNNSSGYSFGSDVYCLKPDQPRTDYLRTGARQTLNEAYSSGTKYLRLALFAEFTATGSGTKKNENIAFSLRFNTDSTVTTSDNGTTNSMSKPSDSYLVSGTWNGQDYNGGASNSEYSFYQQTTMHTLTMNSSNTLLFDGVAFNGTTKGWGSANYTSTETNKVSDALTNICTYDGSEGIDQSKTLFSANNSCNQRYEPTKGVLIVGFFATVRLSEDVYNALINGRISFSTTINSSGENLGTAPATYYTFSYVGLGHAESDDVARTANGFEEIVGYVGNARNHRGDAASINAISNQYFSVTNGVSNGNNKYIRFGLWGTFNASSGCDCRLVGVGFNFSFASSPDSNSTSFSGIDANSYASGPVLVQDYSGIKSINLKDDTASDDDSIVATNLSKYSNATSVTSAYVLPTRNGHSYTLTVTDIWGNTASRTFKYFSPVIQVNGYTEDAFDDYSGGGIGLAFGSDSGGGNISAQLYQRTTRGTIFYVYAKPNDGYYFAGYTYDNVFSSTYNTELNSSNSNYVLDTTNIEHAYKFTINVPDASIPLDGVIKVQVYFKAIPTTGAGSYDYDKTEKSVSVTESELSNVVGSGYMGSTVEYRNSSSQTITAPKHADTYTVTSYVTWNAQRVGKKVETITISPVDLSANFAVTETSKIYDGTTDWANSKVSYEVVGTKGNDSDLLHLAYDTILSGKDAGSVNVIVSNLVLTGDTEDGYDISNNYNLVTTGATLTDAVTINPMDVTVVFNTTGKVYDGTTTAQVGVESISTIVGSETISYTESALSATYDTKDVGTDKVVTLTNPTPTYSNGALQQNYNISTNADSLKATITKKDLTVSYEVTLIKVYDGNTVAQVGENPTFSGHIPDDEAELLLTITADYVDANAGEKDVNVSIVLSGDEAHNYSYTQSETKQGKINKRNIKITAEDKTSVYGDVEDSLTYTLSSIDGEGYASFVTEDDLTSADISLARLEGNTVGTYDIIVSYNNNNNNYFVSAEKGTYTITQRVLTTAYDVSPSKVYDGLTTANVSGIGYSNYVSGDESKLTLTVTADYVDANAGTDKVINVTITLSGSMAFNYSYDTTDQTVGDITKRNIKITAEDRTSVYGNADSILGYILSSSDGEGYASFVTEEDLTLAGISLSRTSGKGAGTYTITPSCNNTNSNYELTIGEGTYTITAREISISILPQTSVYGTVNVNSTVDAFEIDTTDGKLDLADGDTKGDLNVTISKSAGVDVGSYDLTFTYNNDNYVINETTGTYTITPQTLTATYVNESKLYGIDPEGTVSYSGYQYDDASKPILEVLTTTASVDFSGIKNANGYIPVRDGGYTLTPAGATAKNYVVSYVSGTLTVEKAPLSVTYNEDITYGATPATQITSSKFVVTGLRDGEDKSVLSVTSNLPKNAGTYEDVDQYFTFSANNYVVTSISGEYVINKAPLEVTSSTAYITYGGAVEVTFTYGTHNGNFVNGEYKDLLVNNGQLTLASMDYTSLLNASGFINVSPQEGYDLTSCLVEATATNYEITYALGKLHVGKATITLTYLGESKVYDGKAPTPSKDNVTISGIIAPETVESIGFTYELNVNAPGTDVKSYTIYQTSNANSLTNYKLTYVASGTYDITKAPLTVKYKGETITYGTAPSGDLEYIGLVNGETEAVITAPTVDFSGITGANGYVPVLEGGYTLTPAGATAKNYDISYESGILVVEKRGVTVTLNNQGSVYGKSIEVKQDEYSAENLVGEDSFTLTITKQEGIKAGEYELSASTTENNYYIETLVKGKYVISKATLTVNIVYNYNHVLDVDVENISEGDFIISYTGFVYTDSQEDLSATTPVRVDVATLKARISEPGSYNIPYIEGEDDNYTFIYGTYIIEVKESERDVDISGLSFTGATVPYNGEYQRIEVVWENKPEDVEVTISYTDGGLGYKNAGSYDITASFNVVTAGYKNNIPSLHATLVITPLDVEITLKAQTSVYGEEIRVESALDVGYTITDGTIISGDDLGVTVTKSNVMNANHGEYDLSATCTNTNYLVSVIGNVYTITNRAVTITLENQVGIYAKSATIGQRYTITEGSLHQASDLSLVVKVENSDVYNVGESYEIYAEITPNAWYDFTVINATYTVEPMELTLTLQDVVGEFGSTVPTYTDYTKSAELVDEGDDLALTFSLTSAERYVVGGNYVISAVASNPNYIVTVESAKYVVTPKNISIKMADQESVYGESYVFTSEFDILEGSELVAPDTKEDLGVQVIPVVYYDAATYAEVIGASWTNTNYALNIKKGNYTIHKATTHMYLSEGYRDTFTYTGSQISLSKTANSYVYTNRPEPQANVRYPADVIVDAGTYVVTYTIVATKNYTEASLDVVITVQQATPEADLSKLDDLTYVYNGSLQEIKLPDSDVVVKADDDVVVTWENNTFENVPEGGIIEVSVTLQETKNYVQKTFTHKVVVNKATYDLVASGYQFESLTVDYDGEEHFIQVVGLPEGVSVTYILDGASQEEPFKFVDAGIYLISATYTHDEVNYHAPSGLIYSAYVEINPIEITVVVTNQQGYYGDPITFNSDFVTDLAGNPIEGVDVELKLEPKDKYEVGEHAIAGAISSGNYIVTIAPTSDKYKIIPRPITVTAVDRESQYGDELLPLEYTVNEGGLVYGDTLAGNLATAVDNRKLGEYPITEGDLRMRNANYSITFVDGTYSIVKRSITIIVKAQEGTSLSKINKKGYEIRGSKILKGDNLDIQVLLDGEGGTEPGRYPLTATYTENEAVDVALDLTNPFYTLKRVTTIRVHNIFTSKLYDGIPYVFDVDVSSGAEPIFKVDGIFVENSFTEVGVYNLSISASANGDYAEPDTYRFTFEIRPTELNTEVDGISFKVSTPDGFGALDKLVAEHDPSVTLSGDDYTSKVNTAFIIYVERDGEKVPLEEYMDGKEVHIKIKMSEELTEIGANVWLMDGNQNVLHEGIMPDEEGYVEVSVTEGKHVVFVTARDEATPILIVASGMGFIFLVMAFFFLFRKKFINQY